MSTEFALDKLCSISAGSLIRAVGEPFLILDRTVPADERFDKAKRVRGIFDESIMEQAVTSEVPVYTDAINIFFRDSMTGGRLSRRRHHIYRECTKVTYKITDFRRDSNASTSYLVEEVDESDD